jgi:hypothetical protein
VLAHLIGLNNQAPTLFIVQAQPFVSKLFVQHTILFLGMLNNVLL